MKVWHGSYTAIDEIDLSKSIPNKDFGKGFYVTKFRHHAENWAAVIGGRHRTKGVVTEFEYTETEFTRSVCKIRHFENYNEEWLDFVVMNRNKNIPHPAHEYDIVEGPVADDKVQNRIDDYLKGKVSKADFLADLKWHEQTHQICFCTGRSLQMIDRLNRGSDLEWHITKIGEPVVERLMLDYGMDEQSAGDKFFSSIAFTSLSDESTNLYLKPWQEIYALLKEELKM